MKLATGTRVQSVFKRIICLDYYDGPVAGLAETDSGVAVYWFDKLAWDDLQDCRIFLFESVAVASFEVLVRRFALCETPRWPVWVPHIENRVFGEVKKAITPRSPALIIASDDALTTIKAAKHIETDRDEANLTKLVRADAPVDQWLRFLER